MREKKTIIILILVLTIGIVGLTIAYFSNSSTVNNIFTTQPYGTTVTETFTSPSNWLPGQEVDKTVVATNTGNVDEAVRISFTENWKTKNNGTLNGWIHQDGSKSSHTTESELANDERVAVIDFDNDSDWDYEDGYYYYKYKIAPGETTSSLIKSVTFNAKTKLDDTCTTTEGNGTKTITCNSSGSDYDHATYTLTFTVETVQYDKYAEAWQLPQNTTIAIGGTKPQGVNFAQAIMSKSNAASITNYTDGVTTEAYTFNHEATAQTPALTDYRYIGASPNNYVEFNCDDNGENCEVWRAIGVFYVDDGNNNWEWRVKLVRGSSIKNDDWNTAENTNSGYNDWTEDNATLKLFLNGAYYNNTGDAQTGGYGLQESARNMIEDAKYYLGAFAWNNSLTTEQLYSNERGSTLCGSCGTDTQKLTWIGKVGLMYPSDMYMTYKGVNDACYNTPANSSNCNSTNAANGWIYNPYYTWFLSPSSSSSGAVFVAAAGNLGLNHAGYNFNGVRPVVYLKSDIKIDGGTGEVGNPYVLTY